MNRIIILLGLWMACGPVFSQQILNFIPVHGGSNGLQTSVVSNDDVEKDEDDYFILFKDGPIDKEVFIGNQFFENIPVESHLIKPNGDKNFIVRINQENEFEDVVFIKNTTQIQDFDVYDDKIFASIWTDTFPVFINQTDTIYFDAQYEGAIAIIDENMRLEKVLRPSSSRISQVLVDEHSLYGMAHIASEMPYILIGGDTVFNYMVTVNDSIQAPGNASWALFRYDLEGDSISWSRRLGSTSTEQLLDLEFDKNGDLVIVGVTSATMWITLNDVDTLTSAAGGGFQETFIAKYESETGAFIWGYSTPEVRGDTYLGLYITSQNEIVIKGSYGKDSLLLGDTTLIDYNPETNFNSFQRGYILKLSEFGQFQWTYQLDGDAYLTSIKSLTEVEDGEIILTSSVYNNSEVKIQNQEYSIESHESLTFIITLNYNTGKILRHHANKTPDFSNYGYIDRNDAGNIFMVAEARDPATLFGMDFPYSRGYNIIMELDPQYLTPVQEINHGHPTFDLYPNPIYRNQQFHITLSETPAHSVQVEIYNLSGQCLERHAFHKGQKELNIEYGIQKAGLYIIHVQDKYQTSSRMLFIE